MKHPAVGVHGCLSASSPNLQISGHPFSVGHPLLSILCEMPSRGRLACSVAHQLVAPASLQVVLYTRMCWCNSSKHSSCSRVCSKHATGGLCCHILFVGAIPFDQPALHDSARLVFVSSDRCVGSALATACGVSCCVALQGMLAYARCPLLLCVLGCMA